MNHLHICIMFTQEFVLQQWTDMKNQKSSLQTYNHNPPAIHSLTHSHSMEFITIS